MFNDYYWRQYEKLLDYKDALDEYLETLDDNSEEWKQLNELILDILDIDCYIDRAFEKIEKNKKYKNIVDNCYNS